MAKNIIGKSILMSWIKEFKSKCLVCPFKEIAKYLWSKLSAFFWRYRWISYILLAAFAIAACNLAVVHIYFIKFGKTPDTIIKWLPDLFLRIIRTDSEKLITDGHYAIIIADLIAICAFMFAALPILQGVIYKIRLKRDLLEEFGFDFVPVKKAGVDDLEEMLKRYKGADELTIFCGGFDWIGINEELKNFLLDFAKGGKLKLISFRDEKKVKAAFESKGYMSLFNKLHEHLKDHFIFDSGLDGIKCTIINIVGERTLLFRQSSGEHEFNAGFLGSSKYSRQLLGILFKFVDEFVKIKDWSETAAPTTTDPAGQSEQG